MVKGVRRSKDVLAWHNVEGEAVLNLERKNKNPPA